MLHIAAKRHHWALCQWLETYNDYAFFPLKEMPSGCFTTIVLDVLFWIFLLKLPWNEKQWLLKRALFYLVFL